MLSVRGRSTGKRRNRREGKAGNSLLSHSSSFPSSKFLAQTLRSRVTERVHEKDKAKLCTDSEATAKKEIHLVKPRVRWWCLYALAWKSIYRTLPAFQRFSLVIPFWSSSSILKTRRCAFGFVVPKRHMCTQRYRDTRITTLMENLASSTAHQPLRLVIIGGVGGGLSAAARARRLNEQAQIVVLEKGDHVSFANCGLPYAIGSTISDQDKLILNKPKSLIARHKIDVRIRCEVLKIDRESKTLEIVDRSQGQHVHQLLPYDKLIISTGAVSILPPVLQGQEHATPLQTINQLGEILKRLEEATCQSVAVIGGGFIGLEVVENLSEIKGLVLSIVEAATHVLPPMDDDMTGPLHQEIRKHNVNLHLETTIDRIEKDDQGKRILILKNGSNVPADLIIVAIGIAPVSILAKHAGLELGLRGTVKVNDFLQTSDKDIYAVGDVVSKKHLVSPDPAFVALAGLANRQGRSAADHIFGTLKGTKPFKPAVGTAVVKVFSLTAASVGFSVRSLKMMGIESQWVTVHPPNHAGYYPGAKQMTLKVIFCPQDAKILGAQCVGAAGVDKRIDVIATAMQAGMLVSDLADLELSYAPPYGSAKDPINMAGFVAENVLDDIVSLFQPEELRKGGGAGSPLFIDVRERSEFEAGHLKDAVHIPLDSLRASLHRIPDKEREIVVYCQVGFRGYLASRILRNSGYRKVKNVNGGFKSVSSIESLQEFWTR
ncbi:FAD/NAD(P)-binding domain-containing protein [Violaceomyces palustris]|uniref:FAD/NAD(P)-binding domain-containing protein n=1 Tax=Violaceomyces palustris TaxID=1673888 RepID=A0ACD0NPZ1_9BASI|nr:FAD/NAD(P)-binding domain-containing protein [Violaceomyces palustris]